MEQPILGYGKANPFAKRFDAKMEYSPNMHEPHNAFLYFILNNGVIVSFFFFAFMITLIIQSVKNLIRTKCLLFIYIPLYWLAISITGGDYFNFRFNIGSVVMGISLFGLLFHPGLEQRTE